MGADIYISKLANLKKREQDLYNILTDANQGRITHEEYSQKILELSKNDEEYYFRDSYNSSSLLNALGLSWWQDVSDMLDENENSELTVDQIKKLKKLVEENKHYLEEIKDPEESEYFNQKYERFITFLQKAIDLNSTLYCSI